VFVPETISATPVTLYKQSENACGGQDEIADLPIRGFARSCANDHDQLRHDPLLQTAVGKVTALASSPTSSRLETRIARADIAALNRVLVEQFIAPEPRA
jgi:hypothetical protein